MYIIRMILIINNNNIINGSIYELKNIIDDLIQKESIKNNNDEYKIFENNLLSKIEISYGNNDYISIKEFKLLFPDETKHYKKILFKLGAKQKTIKNVRCIKNIKLKK